MKKWLRVAGLLSVFLLMVASLAYATPQESTESYLIGFREGGSAGELGVEVVDEWAGLSAAHVKATPAVAKGLLKNPKVAYVEPDVQRFARSRSFADGDLTWGLQAVKAPDAWKMGATGSGIKVCILDTGIDATHPEFARPDGSSVIAAAEDFTRSHGPYDAYGHGTHVAGTIAGQTNASGSYIGVAPNVELYIAKVLDDSGSGMTSWIIRGMQWCTDQGANIASLSLGSDRSSITEERQFNASYAAGMLIIAAAGNEYGKTVSYPASYDSVVSVAAVDNTLQKADFSNFNPDVELAAPGVSVLSSVPVGRGVRSTTAEDGVTYTSVPLEYASTGSVTGPLVECGIADTTTSCTGIPASGPWVAMINRGSIAFSAKVTNVMSQGAAAAILANNDTASPDALGSFTLGSAGAWIPTTTVSYNSGVAIRAGGLGIATVSIDPWDYDFYDGTSMATPHTSAVAALTWSANPSLTNSQVREILQSTAQDLGARGRDVNFGYGLVQADAAVRMAKR